MTKKNREQLIELMEKKKLTNQRVATLLGKSEQTVRCWRSTSGRDISDKVLDELVHLTL